MKQDGRTDERTVGLLYASQSSFGGIKKKNITDGRTDGRTHGQRENSIPTTNKVCGGYNYGEHSTLLLTCIMQLSVMKTSYLSSFELPLKTGFTV